MTSLSSEADQLCQKLKAVITPFVISGDKTIDTLFPQSPSLSLDILLYSKAVSIDGFHILKMKDMKLIRNVENKSEP